MEKNAYKYYLYGEYMIPLMLLTEDPFLRS